MTGRCVFFACFAGFLAGSAYAQLATTTALVGTVSDAKGAMIAEVKVTAVNTGTSETYSALTNEQGNYNIQFVRPGTYNLTLEKSGFQRFQKTGIVVEENQMVRNDATLAVGSLSQSVTVQAEAAVIKTEDASVSENITTRQVSELPLNGRDPMHLAITTAGVFQGQKAANGVPPGEDFIGAGTREIQNEMSLDGISIMNNLITTTPSRPMVEAIQEVQIQTGTYSAQYGAYLGVHINMITKSGTNDLHGAVLEFVRNNIFDARPYFLPATSSQPPLRQNQFGFELDGPIVIPKLYNGRNKTFFMGSYEGLRQIRSTTSTAALLTPQMFTGDFSQYTAKAIVNPLTGQAFPGNIIPASLLSPYTTQLQKYYPKPNLPGVGVGGNNYATSLANNNNTDQTVDRLDQNLGDKSRFFFRYQRQQETILVGAANPTNATNGPVYLSNYDIGYTQILSPTLVNDMRFGRNYFNTATLNYFAVNNLKSAGADLGIPGFNGDVIGNNPGLPEFNVTGFTGWGVSGTNWYQDDSTWQGAEQLSWNKGNHNLMFGAEFRKLETGRAATNSSRGFFNFTGQFSNYAPADFILGLPANLQTYATQVRGLVAEWRDGFFALDNWQVSRKLTINYGLRYELPTVPYTVNGYATELNPEQTALIPANPPVPGFKFTYPQHKDWAPRVGFAYRLSERTVVRGGAGIYYNPNQTNSQTFLNTNPPFATATTYTSNPTTPTLFLTNPTGGPANAPPATPNIITDNWNLKTPRMNQWSFGVEQAAWHNAGIEIQYLGSHSYDLDRSYYNNTPYFPGPGSIQPRRPNQLFGVIRTVQNDEIANYEGLSVVVRQRFWRGMQFLASYTWSHTLDVSSDSNGGGTPMNPYNWRADYGNSNWDIRHRFVASYVWEIPFFRNASPTLRNIFGNWQLNGITTLQSGVPINVSIGTDTANTSSSGSYRPNLVHSPSANCGDGHLTGCIDATAFAAVPTGVYAYGNAGRNLIFGPHLFTTDLSLFKNFRIRERARFELRLEAFNATNSPEFSNPSATFGTATFGSITSTVIDNRDVQLGGRLIW
jgi:hypothetical protein